MAPYPTRDRGILGDPFALKAPLLQKMIPELLKEFLNTTPGANVIKQYCGKLLR
jgi:hypothetical protein